MIDVIAGKNCVPVYEAEHILLNAAAQNGGSMVTLSALPSFDLAPSLTSGSFGRRIVQLKPKQVLFSQGDAADSIFYLQKGRAKVTVLSTASKEATVALLVPHEFIGEEALSTASPMRFHTVTAITACSALKISRDEMVRALHSEQRFSDFFLKCLLARSMRTQAHLIDQLFNCSEKRLARTLLLMAEYGGTGQPETVIQQISQQTLADMIGTTRSRVSFFMNRFRELGLIEYNRRIRVHKSLLNALLRDSLPNDNTAKPAYLVG
jgi:CRP/FNR family cyclic AMP-dependent transcriptional regulator